MATKARIAGNVTYREGDGMPIVIPTGPCEINESFDGVTISWHDGDTAGVAAMPKADFALHVANQAIVLETP